jgi:cytochrome c oxidase cbb3-type subunit 3
MMNCSKSILAACGTASLLLLTLLIHTPMAAQQPSGASGQAIFTANCGACHGSDGRGGERAPSIASRREVLALKDDDLIRIVQNGISGVGMPAFGYLGADKVKAVVGYLRTLQGFGAAVKAPGDPRAGEGLFYGKAACATCHMVNGRGGFIASDLSGYGLGRSTDDIRAAILDPDRTLDHNAQSVTVITTSDLRLKGLVRAEDNFSVALQTEDGAFHVLPRERIVRVENSGHSLMPQDYESKLSSKEIDDLISYLLKANTVEKQADGGDEE